MEAYRQAGRVGVLQEGLEDHGEVFLEEAVAVEQLLQAFLRIPQHTICSPNPCRYTTHTHLCLYAFAHVQYLEGEIDLYQLPEFRRAAFRLYQA